MLRGLQRMPHSGYLHAPPPWGQGKLDGRLRRLKSDKLMATAFVFKSLEQKGPPSGSVISEALVG